MVAPWLRLIKVIAILLGSVLVICVVLPIILLVAASWLQNVGLSNMQQRNVEWVINHAYPGSRIIRADGQIADWPAGSHVYVGVQVTFSSSDSFDAISTWYVNHPEGGRAGVDLDEFPTYGLDKLNDDSPGTTIYRVSYIDVSSCEFPLAPCAGPRQRIR
jgi:hypothetical protein